MKIDVVEESFEAFDRYLAVRSAFETSALLEVIANPGAWRLVERPLAEAFSKDYDAAEDPHGWPVDFDVSNWLLLAAYTAERRAGGAIVALATPGVDMLEGRNDLAVLWDIRVDASLRRSGVGRALLTEVERRARQAGCKELKVETQNTNPGACRFYARSGFRLSEVHPDAYPSLPGEIQLIWRKALS